MTVDLFAWRRALLSEDGPVALRRHVLLVLSTYGDEKGADIYPSTRELARATGMSRRRVEGHLREAEAEGWIRRRQGGKGQGWRRTQYDLRTPPQLGTERPRVEDERGDTASPPHPPNLETERPHLTPERGDAVARRGDDGDMNVGTQRPTTSPETSPETSPTPPEGAAGAAGEGEGDRMSAGELLGRWIDLQGDRPPDAVVRKQGAAAKRLVRQFTPGDLVQAMDGMGQLYPHSAGEPWDLFRLERRMAEAIQAGKGTRNGARRTPDGGRVLPDGKRLTRSQAAAYDRMQENLRRIGAGGGRS